MKIAVLGSGAWGTALAMLLQKNGHEVSLWSYCEEESHTLRERGENKMLPGVPLPKGLALTHREDIVAGCELVVFAPPSYAMRQTAQRVKPYLTPGTVLVTVAKGVEPESGLRMSEILAEELPGYAVAALSGPSHAEEVAREMPTGCVAACPEMKTAEWVQGIFMNPSFRVYSSTDITGVELCGAAKNIIALAAGMAEGMGCGDNAKALMMSRALVELSALIKAAGGQENTCFGLAGMGDMIVTCTSPHSRNHMAGVAIGRGEHVAGALGERHAVVEGYYAAQSVTALAQKLGVHMPICECVYDILFKGTDFSIFTRDTVDFYEDALSGFLVSYVDGFREKGKRDDIEKKIRILETYVNSIPEDYVRNILEKRLFLCKGRFSRWDVNKVKAEYSYKDKCFLNVQIEKYGSNHLNDVLYTVYLLNISELLPEILISISSCFTKAIRNSKEQFAKEIIDSQVIVDMIILKSFIFYSDEIKKDEKLINAYEDILLALTEIRNEKAAVLLDEFRIH